MMPIVREFRSFCLGSLLVGCSFGSTACTAAPCDECDASEQSEKDDEDDSSSNTKEDDSEDEVSSSSQGSQEEKSSSTEEDSSSKEGKDESDQSDAEPVPKEFEGKKNPYDADDEAALKEGKALYDEHCSGCHGKNGEGELPGCPDFSSKKSATLPDDRLIWKVSAGSGDAMPASKGILTEAQMWKAITYLRTLSK